MHKSIRFGLVLLPLLTLCSCYSNGFDEATNSFIESFNITSAMNNIKVASLTKVSTLIDNGEILGKETTTIEFDKSDEALKLVKERLAQLEKMMQEIEAFEQEQN